jgi:hypothetical protein
MLDHRYRWAVALLIAYLGVSSLLWRNFRRDLDRSPTALRPEARTVPLTGLLARVVVPIFVADGP